MTARTDIVTFVAANWTKTPVLMLDDFVAIEDIPAVNEQPVLLIDFPPATEQLVTVAVNNAQGWRESGSVQFIMLHPIGQNADNTRLLTEELRDLIRAQRIDRTVLGSVEPFTAFGQYDGKWQLYISLAEYYRDAFA